MGNRTQTAARSRSAGNSLHIVIHTSSLSQSRSSEKKDFLVTLSSNFGYHSALRWCRRAGESRLTLGSAHTNEPPGLGQALHVVLKEPLNKMSSILPSWSLQPLNGCSLQASIWASLTKGGTKMLPPDLLETTLLNQGQDWQEELGGRGRGSKMGLEQTRGFGSYNLGSAQPAPGRSLPQYPPTLHPRSPYPHCGCQISFSFVGCCVWTAPHS